MCVFHLTKTVLPPILFTYGRKRYLLGKKVKYSLKKTGKKQENTPPPPPGKNLIYTYKCLIEKYFNNHLHKYKHLIQDLKHFFYIRNAGKFYQENNMFHINKRILLKGKYNLLYRLLKSQVQPTVSFPSSGS